MSYFEVSITKTCRFYNEKEYHGYDETTKHFKTFDDVKQWLKNEYGKSKRQKMYRDNIKTGDSNQVGYVIGFKNKWDKCYEQHWIEIVELIPKNPFIKRA